MASLLSALNKSAFGTRNEQKTLVRQTEQAAADKRAELERLIDCMSGQNTDCVTCIRIQYCERRKRAINVSIVVD